MNTLAITAPLLGVAIILNALLLIFALRHRVASRSATLLVRSQAALDLLVVSTNLVFVQLQVIPRPTEAVEVNLPWIAYCLFGNEGTIIVWYLIVCSIYNSIAFSIERCLCICCPFWWKKHKRTALKIFYCSVFSSGFFGYIPATLLAAWPQITSTEPPNSSDPYIMHLGAMSNVTSTGPTDVICDYRNQVPETLTNTIVWLCWCTVIFLPNGCMIGCYIAIIVQLRRSSALMRQQQQATSKSQAASRRLTLIIGLTVVAFIVFNMPESCSSMLWYVDPVTAASFDPVAVMFVLPFLSAINSLVNPLIYLGFHPQFRQFVFRCCRRHQG